MFENVVGGRRAIGDGAYLFDRKGDMHAYIQYPCQLSCRDPAAGRVDVLATSRGTEYITIRNTSSQPLDLTHYEIENQPWFYEFPRGTVLAPGEELVLFVVQGSDGAWSRLEPGCPDPRRRQGRRHAAEPAGGAGRL